MTTRGRTLKRENACTCVMRSSRNKQEKESTADFERMLKDALAKKNAPDGAEHHHRAMKPDNKPKTGFICIVADSGRKGKNEIV